jgi:hypothetical protein
MHHCDICQRTFTCNKSLQRHLKCTSHKLRVENPLKLNLCCCGKSFKHPSNLYRHRSKCESERNRRGESKKICDTKNDVNLKINEMEQKLVVYERNQRDFEKERDDLRSQISLLLDKLESPHNTTHNNTNIESQLNNNITININAFGNENTEYLDDKTVLQCIDRVYKSIPALLQKIHFDPKHPENHNIKITNKKLPYASVMGNNKRWKTVDRKDAIDKMVTNGYYILDEKYETNKLKFDPRKQKNFERFQQNFEREEKNTMKVVKGDVEMMVINGGES